MSNQTSTRYAMTSSRALVVRSFLAVLAGLCITGCKVELHSELHEVDANEMIAVLARHDIDSVKSNNRGGRHTIEVDQDDVAAAVDVLQRNGLPRKRFDNMGDLFRKKGLISSPLEERARFIYAMQENLQETLSQIDGVIVARVHVVLPENDPFADGAGKASSASVFIKHSPQYDLTELRSDIKMIVGNSIQGLTYRDVTVTLIRASSQGTRRDGADTLPAAEPAGSRHPATVVLSVLFVLGGLWLSNKFIRTYFKRRTTPAVQGTM